MPPHSGQRVFIDHPELIGQSTSFGSPHIGQVTGCATSFELSVGPNTLSTASHSLQLTVFSMLPLELDRYNDALNEKPGTMAGAFSMSD
jgi:hypothetical protein